VQRNDFTDFSDSKVNIRASSPCNRGMPNMHARARGVNTLSLRVQQVFSAGFAHRIKMSFSVHKSSHGKHAETPTCREVK
jgi:hypothetical protein